MPSGPILECVPNFSEGTDPEIVRKIVAAMRVDGVSLLDWSRDAAHNRSVVTIAGPPSAVCEAAILGAGAAARLIDLTRQSGVHPRIGAADVIPFVPVHGISIAEAALLARQAGMQIWRRFGVPVYFYGAAAARPDRVELEDVRRGQFEGLRDAARKDASRRPDVGGPELHPTAGASAVGARSFLIAYNIYLASGKGVASGKARGSHAAHSSPQQLDISAARAIARDIRASNGGLPGVKAIGVVAGGRAQVSMNITDFRATPMQQVYARVRELAERHGALITDGELVGLIPEAALAAVDATEWIGEVPGFDPDAKILERKLHHPLDWPTE